MYCCKDIQHFEMNNSQRFVFYSCSNPSTLLYNSLVCRFLRWSSIDHLPSFGFHILVTKQLYDVDWKFTIKRYTFQIQPLLLQIWDIVISDELFPLNIPLKLRLVWFNPGANSDRWKWNICNQVRITVWHCNNWSWSPFFDTFDYYWGTEI